MDYRNKLGVFMFDDDTSPTLVELVACTVMGQYLNPKPGERPLTDEESCYEFILNDCGNVLSKVGFDLEIRDEIRVYTQTQLRAKQIKEFDARVAAAAQAKAEADFHKLLDEEDEYIQQANEQARHWLVGPAAVGC